MMGMGFLRLNKILRRHKWKNANRSEREEEIRKARKREDRLLYGCLFTFAAGLVFLIVVLNI